MTGRGLLFASIVCASVGVAGCSNERTRTIEVVEVTAVSLDRDIFLPRCAFSACHGGDKPAAHLDLQGGLCGTNLQRASCLFSSKSLVVAGAPERSFLIDKLTGENLKDKPETDCATTGNARMPYGGTSLTTREIERVRAWIAGGAACEGRAQTGDGGGGDSDAGQGLRGTPDAGTPDAGTTDAGTTDAGTTAVGGVATLSFGTAKVRAGMRTMGIVRLPYIAGSAGLTVALETDAPSALAIPSAVFVPSGASESSFDVQGKRPATSIRVTAMIDGISIAANTLAVDGLFLAEIFWGGLNAATPANNDTSQWVKLVNSSAVSIDLGAYAIASGRTRYASTLAGLTGILAAGQCAVVGGPTMLPGNGGQAGDLSLQVLDFMPDLPYPAGIGTNTETIGLGLFASDVTATDIAQHVPIDSIVVGPTPSPGFLDELGRAVSPSLASVSPTQTAFRSGRATFATAAVASANGCPSGL